MQHHEIASVFAEAFEGPPAFLRNVPAFRCLAGRDWFELHCVRRQALSSWRSSDFAPDGSGGWSGILGFFRHHTVAARRAETIQSAFARRSQSAVSVREFGGTGVSGGVAEFLVKRDGRKTENRLIGN
jgi:hypothetical protein